MSQLLSKIPSVFRRRVGRKLLLLGIFFYFGFHLLSGHNSVLAMIQLSQKVKNAEESLASLQEQKATLQSRVNMLYKHSLDLDMLGEQARRQLGYSKKGEVVSYIKEDQDNNQTN